MPGAREPSAATAPRPAGPAYDSRELSALLTAYDLLEQIPPGLFRKETSEARTRLKQLLYRRPTGRGELKDRVRLLMPQNRRIDEHRFQAVLTSLVTEKRLKITYRNRTREATQTRVVSPQRLTFYRSNWYLAAWCHVRRDLRVFALDRVATADLTPIPAHMLASQVLDTRLSTGYGIFEGEAELALIISKRAVNVKAADYKQYIFGYTCFIDGSARGLPPPGNVFFQMKSRDTFCPLGPWIVTADEIADPQKLGIELKNNGATMQKFNTDDMAHQIPRVIEWLSSIHQIGRAHV